METAVWLIVMIPMAGLFTGLGIYAWRRKKPMWFWSGSEVKAEEIEDVAAYNRANGAMWLAFSGVFWVSAALGLMDVGAAGTMLAAGVLGGIPCLIFSYGKIYAKYKKKA